MQHFIYTDSHEETLKEAHHMMKKNFKDAKLSFLDGEEFAYFTATDQYGERIFRVELYLLALGVGQIEEPVICIRLENGIYTVVEKVTTYSRNMEFLRLQGNALKAYKTKRGATKFAQDVARTEGYRFDDNLY